MNEEQMRGLVKDAERAQAEELLRNQSLRTALDEAQENEEQYEIEIEDLKAKIADLIDALEDVVNQACWVNSENILDSMALSANAHGLRELAKHRKVKITNQVGRRVIAEWIPQGKK